MEEEIKYIYGIPKFSKKSTMENTKEFIRRLGNPCKDKKIVHIAGTNGKGSVCSYLDNILRAAGKKTGVFTSPHLVNINERIVINGCQVTDEEFERSFKVVKKTALEMVQDGLTHPSFFEFLYGMGMEIFDRTDVEYVILETGLGGRLDATNSFMNPVLTVITSISLDHTDILGDTYEKIAYEKAGIIKNNVPVVFMEKRKDVKTVIVDMAKKRNAPVISFDRKDVQVVDKTDKYIDFSLNNGYYCNERFRICTKGIYQCENASLALTCAAVLGVLDVQVCQQGLLNSVWIGRMQDVGAHVIIDGAHNEDGIRRFIESVSEDGCTGRRLLLFSAVKDKHYDIMINELTSCGLFDVFYTAAIDDARGLDAGIIRQNILEYLPDAEIVARNDIPEAYNAAFADKGEDDYLYVAGSLYLAGEVLSYRAGHCDGPSMNI